MKKSTILAFVFASFFSCNKENIAVTATAVNFMNLKVGNYWIYDWYQIDSVNQVSMLNRRDSIIIERDTVINGKTCFIKRGNFLGGEQITKTILFDSINSIFSFPERKLMLTLEKSLTSVEKFGTETNPIAIGYYGIDNTEIPIEVPAGNFKAINFRGKIEPLQTGYTYGTRYNDNYYADNIGLIKVITQFYSSPNNIEMRLVKYGSIK